MLMLGRMLMLESRERKKKIGQASPLPSPHPISSSESHLSTKALLLLVSTFAQAVFDCRKSGEKERREERRGEEEERL